MIDLVLVVQQAAAADYVPPGPPGTWWTWLAVGVGVALIGVAVGSVLVRWIQRRD